MKRKPTVLPGPPPVSESMSGQSGGGQRGFILDEVFNLDIRVHFLL